MIRAVIATEAEMGLCFGRRIVLFLATVGCLLSGDAGAATLKKVGASLLGAVTRCGPHAILAEVGYNLPPLFAQIDLSSGRRRDVKIPGFTGHVLGCSPDGRWIYVDDVDYFGRFDIEARELEGVAMGGSVILNPDASVLLVEGRKSNVGAVRETLARWGMEVYALKPRDATSYAVVWGAGGRQFLIERNLKSGDVEGTGQDNNIVPVLFRGTLSGGELALTPLGRHFFQSIGLIWFDKRDLLLRTDPEDRLPSAYWCSHEAQSFDGCRHTQWDWTDIAPVPGRKQFFAVRGDGRSDCLVLTVNLDILGECIARMNHIVLGADRGPIVFRDPTEIVLQATDGAWREREDPWDIFVLRP